MAHAIGERDIQTGIEQAWHGLTNVVEHITRENSGIDYHLVGLPLEVKIGDQYVRANGKQIVSLDDSLPIGNPVGDDYCIIDNSEIFDLVENSMSGTPHKLVSVGTVSDRTKGFISIKLDEAFTSASRLTEPTLNILWGHSGAMPLIARSGFTVVVCQNTFNMALGRKGNDFSLSLKHSKFASLQLANFERAIENHYGVVAEFRRAMDSFENVECDTEKATKIFFGSLAPDTFERDLKISTRLKNTIECNLVPLFKNGAGNQGRTLADVFNAGTDYFTHSSAGSNQSNNWKQFQSSEFGAGNRSKADLFNVLNDQSLLSSAIVRGEKALMAMAS